MNQPDFGKKLVEVRKAIGLTQEELADKCRVTSRTIQRIESGEVKPRAYTIKLISSALGFDFFETSSTIKDDIETNQDSKLKLFSNLLWYLKDLFNLKTNTMRKLSILTIIFCAFCIGLFTLTSDSKAQESAGIDLSKYMRSDSRGIIYFFPKGKELYISNVKDTADYKIMGDLVQEYKNRIFLNGKYFGKALMSDTIIYSNGELILKTSYWEYTSSYGQDIHYLIPIGIPINNVSVQIDTENIYISDHHIREFNYQIYLDGVFQGKVQEGDTVIFREDSIIFLD